LNYARRQEYRRLSRAGRAAAGSVVAALLALVFAGARAAPLAGLLLLTAFGLGLYARHWLSLAGRSRVGARSEDDVQRALAPLEVEGWRPPALSALARPGRHRLDPPARALVLSIDEKTGIQARGLARADTLPKAGKPARRDYEYTRNWTMNLFAALRVHSGETHAMTCTTRNSPTPSFELASGLVRGYAVWTTESWNRHGRRGAVRDRSGRRAQGHLHG
jgi:hypothetical protein